MNNLFSFSLLAAGADSVAFRQTLNSAMTVLFLLLIPLAVLAVFLEVMRIRTRRSKKRRIIRILTIPVYLLSVFVLVFAFYCRIQISNLNNTQINNPVTSSTATGSVSSSPTAPTQPTKPTEPPDPTLPVKPHYTDKSNPQNWNIKWETNVDGNWTQSYQRPESIYFGLGEDYFALPGIAGFRGNNYRDTAAYGSVNVTKQELEIIWQQNISSLPKPSGTSSWTGSGWTGQPLVVQWDQKTRSLMNLYPSKKAKDNLVEVIYATLDGHIYFYDFENGDYTRDPMNIGMAFKGAGALDPRGYPIMYVGSGDRTQSGKEPRMYIINLIDCSIMYEYGHEKEYNIRNWRAFDASPLVDAETDTLIWPGENGLLYTIKLNTSYNQSTGQLSIAPDKPVLNRYMTDLNTDPSNDLGMENSPIIVEGYLYVGDNRGTFFCVDLNTMELVWAQEIKDDMNATAVFEWGDDGQGYLYLGTSTEHSKDTCYMYKLNAATGEIVWEVPWHNVQYDKLVSGGVLSSPVLGRKGTNFEGMIFFHVAKSPAAYDGVFLALNTKTGEVIWQKTMKYCWSSPVAIYSKTGEGYLILCDSVGYMHLIDGTIGNILYSLPLGSNIEASPAVFNNMVVVGTRGQKVYGIHIS